VKVLNAASEFTRSISISRHQVYRKLHQTYIVQKQKYSANQEKNSYWPYDIKLRNKANSHIQPDNPQVDIATTGRCEYWITDIDIIMKHQGNDTESPSDDPILPEVYTATAACICNVDGKCDSMLTPERLNILQRASEKVRYSGLHDNTATPPPPHPWILHQNS